MRAVRRRRERSISYGDASLLKEGNYECNWCLCGANDLLGRMRFRDSCKPKSLDTANPQILSRCCVHAVHPGECLLLLIFCPLNMLQSEASIVDLIHAKIEAKMKESEICKVKPAYVGHITVGNCVAVATSLPTLGLRAGNWSKI